MNTDPPTPYDVIHPSECTAVHERRQLTDRIIRATGMMIRTPSDGSEEQLKRAFSVLEGIFHEYCDGGDQMTENCDCGSHTTDAIRQL